MAFTIAGWQWPSAVTATPPAKSIYMRPSWSHTRDPSPRTGMNGAGAKHGTMTSSNVARVTGSELPDPAAATSRLAEVAMTALADCDSDVGIVAMFGQAGIGT